MTKEPRLAGEHLQGVLMGKLSRTRDGRDEDELVTCLLTASRALIGVSIASLADLHGEVTLSQLRTLVVLRVHGPTRLKRLCERLQISSTAAERRAEDVIAAGLACRRDSALDGPDQVIALTAQGRRLVHEVTERRRQAIKDIVRAMPDTQIPRLIEALVAFAEAADEPLAVKDW